MANSRRISNGLTIALKSKKIFFGGTKSGRLLPFLVELLVIPGCET